MSTWFFPPAYGLIANNASRLRAQETFVAETMFLKKFRSRHFFVSKEHKMLHVCANGKHSGQHCFLVCSVLKVALYILRPRRLMVL